MGNGFADPQLTAEEIDCLQSRGRIARGDVLRMTTTAGSGHPGGALSSLDIYLTLLAGARVSPEDCRAPARDRIVISHGHTAAGWYAALAQMGFIPREELLATFRRHGSPFEGHVTTGVPGVEWTSGNLGQGLSVGCGMALATRYTRREYQVYVVMGDGEQQKGQLAEAQRFAAHYSLSNLTAIIDCNDLQATGTRSEVMAQDLAAEYTAHGWQVLVVEGHDFGALHAALHEARQTDAPAVLLARTVMGKGVSFMENCDAYHGKILAPDECAKAEAELGVEPCAPLPEARQPARPAAFRGAESPVEERVIAGPPRVYPAGAWVENRAACGQALADLARHNLASGLPLVVLDCDLGPSVKTELFALAAPDHFIQCGIQEHHAAAMAGGLSVCGVLPFFADFGVFALEETYNQQRLNDINGTSIKLIATHCGLDVGEDGKTHQCLDYIGLLANLFNWQLVLPADANQTDRTVRYMATTPGNIALAVGRSKLPVLAKADGTPFFDEQYSLAYGKADWLVRGKDATIVTYGTLAHRAVECARLLQEAGLAVGVLNVSCPLAPDTEALAEAAQTGAIVVYEDHHLRTGLGSLLGAWLLEAGLSCRFRRLGVSGYGGSAAPQALYRDQGLDVSSLAQHVRMLIREAEREPSSPC